MSAKGACGPLACRCCAVKELALRAEERRSWRRRAREAAVFGAALLAASAGHAWRRVRGGWLAPRAAASERERVVGWVASDFLAPGLHTPLTHTLSLATDTSHAGGAAAPLPARRRAPGFASQFALCLSRAVSMRLREPLLVFTDYMIIAATGA